jgi:RHS repeat-associated protein
MIARQRRRMQERAGALMTSRTRESRIAGARATLATWVALLLTTLGVLVGTVTSTAAQSLTRGPVLVETHHTDLAGNIRLSTNEAGDVTQRLDYAPFGEVDNRPCGPTNDPTPAPQFQGKLRDPKTCLDDFGARDYYMVTGRFQSVDPVLPVETALRDPQQWNRYAYARNNPLIYTDPDGRVVWWIAAAAGGAAFGGGLRIAENLYDGRAWNDGVARAAAVGAVTSVVGGALLNGVTRAASVASAASRAATSAATSYPSLSYIGQINSKIYANLEGQLTRDGASTIFKALRSARTALAEHEKKLLEGLEHTSAVEKTIINVKNQIATLEKFIADKGLR